jgi:hypothetical protein
MFIISEIDIFVPPKKCSITIGFQIDKSFLGHQQKILEKKKKTENQNIYGNIGKIL